MEFFLGMFVGAFSVVFAGFSFYITKDKKLDGTDYNNVGGKTLKDMVDSEYDPENYLNQKEQYEFNSSR